MKRYYMHSRRVMAAKKRQRIWLPFLIDNLDLNTNDESTYIANFMNEASWNYASDSSEKITLLAVVFHCRLLSSGLVEAKHKHCQLVKHQQGAKFQEPEIVTSVLFGDGYDCLRRFMLDSEPAGQAPAGRLPFAAFTDGYMVAKARRVLTERDVLGFAIQDFGTEDEGTFYADGAACLMKF